VADFEGVMAHSRLPDSIVEPCSRLGVYLFAEGNREWAGVSALRWLELRLPTRSMPLQDRLWGYDMGIKNSIRQICDRCWGGKKPYAAAPERLWWGGTPPKDYDPDLSRLVAPSLEDLADAFGSDKGTLGAGHRYTGVYTRLIRNLKTLRSSDALSVCEIGVACGASLKMWSQYLPEAKVVGIDVREDCASVCRGWENIEIRIGDPRQLEIAANRFDMIVDDASHISEDIRENFNHCFDWLRPGGYYVVEDTGCVGDQDYAQSLMDRFGRTKLRNERSTFTEMIDTIMLAIDSRSGAIGSLSYYPNMLVIEKRGEAESFGGR